MKKIRKPRDLYWPNIVDHKMLVGLVKHETILLENWAMGAREAEELIAWLQKAIKYIDQEEKKQSKGE
jgi:hypothetical protein